MTVKFRDVPNNQVLFYFGLYRFDNSSQTCDSLSDCNAFVESVKKEQGPIQYNYDQVKCFDKSEVPDWRTQGCGIV